jgi:tetratricopeptide (TPR) repeat protein
VNTLQERDTRSLSVAREFYADSESLNFRSDASTGGFDRLQAPSINTMYARNYQYKPSVLAGTLPLFQVFGIALLLSVCFPLTCGPILGIETIAFGIILLVFIAYNRLKTLGMVLFWLAISFPFAIFYATTFQSSHGDQANRFYEVGEYQHALEAYRADDADGLSNGKNWLSCGDCYFKLGQYQKAFEYYTKASRFQGEKLNLERLPHHFGLSTMKQEQLNMAAVDFRLAKTYEKMGNKRQAQKYFKSAKEQGYKPATWMTDMQLVAQNDASATHASTTHASTHAQKNARAKK